MARTEHGSRILIGDAHVGTVVWGPASDFPWAIGPFTPGPDFALIESFLKADGRGGEELAFSRLHNSGHPGHELLVRGETDDSYCTRSSCATRERRPRGESA